MYFASDQFKPKSYLKLNKKYVFSEGEQFPLRKDQIQRHLPMTLSGKNRSENLP